MKVLNPEHYVLADVDGLPSPRLLVYRERVERNISLIKGYLEEVAPGSGLRHLRTHVKTNKSAWATDVLLQHGAEKFKCTPHELDMLLEAGARDIYVAYPLLAHEAAGVAERVSRHPEARIWAQVGCREHAEILAAAAAKQGVEIDCYLDLDVGMHRTGVAPEAAPDLAAAIRNSPRLGRLRLRGLHAYDGHNHSRVLEERQECARQEMARLVGCLRELERRDFQVENIVAGGTPSFVPCLRELVVHHQVDAEIDVSPGTWIYWDTNYDRLFPGMFEYATLILARVMDRSGPDLITLNLGHKRWAIDHGPVELFSRAGLEVLETSEEHTVLRHPPEETLAVGDAVLIVPRHVCPTVNLWESFSLVGDGGHLEADSLPVSARNR